MYSRSYNVETTSETGLSEVAAFIKKKSECNQGTFSVMLGYSKVEIFISLNAIKEHLNVVMRSA